MSYLVDFCTTAISQHINNALTPQTSLAAVYCLYIHLENASGLFAEETCCDLGTQLPHRPGELTMSTEIPFDHGVMADSVKPAKIDKAPISPRRPSNRRRKGLRRTA